MAIRSEMIRCHRFLLQLRLARTNKLGFRSPHKQRMSTWSISDVVENPEVVKKLNRSKQSGTSGALQEAEKPSS